MTTREQGQAGAGSSTGIVVAVLGLLGVLVAVAARELATVQAGVHKTDVPTRAKERGNEVKERVVERVRDLRDQAVERKGAGLMSAFNKNKVAYESLSLVSGVLSGALAGAIFTRIWRAVSDADEAPEPTALDHNIREVLVAGALQGAVFGLVKAAMGRMTAKGYRRFARNDPER